MPALPPLLTIRDIATQLDVSSCTIRRWTAQARFPAPLRLGDRLVRWHPDDVASWVITHRPHVIIGGCPRI
jgi:excisionase family DNA binding protein